jgi:hypothetical protein
MWSPKGESRQDRRIRHGELIHAIAASSAEVLLRGFPNSARRRDDIAAMLQRPRSLQRLSIRFRRQCALRRGMAGPRKSSGTSPTASRNPQCQRSGNPYRTASSRNVSPVLVRANAGPQPVIRYPPAGRSVRALGLRSECRGRGALAIKWLLPSAREIRAPPATLQRSSCKD